MKDYYEEKNNMLQARLKLCELLNISYESREVFLTLFNILLVRLSILECDDLFWKVLKREWEYIFPNIPYQREIQSFIEDNEKEYMIACIKGISKIARVNMTKKLYKDSIILLTAIHNEKEEDITIYDIREYWENNGKYFDSGLYFDDEFHRMQHGYKKEILAEYKSDIDQFHGALIQKIINTPDIRRPYVKKGPTINEKRIDELEEKIRLHEEELILKEKEVLSQFIALLDSKKYDHVLGKLYNMAYGSEDISKSAMKLMVKNLFEIISIHGIESFGDVGGIAKENEIQQGLYRLDHAITGDGIIKYPGYKMEDTIILQPFVEKEDQ